MTIAAAREAIQRILRPDSPYGEEDLHSTLGQDAYVLAATLNTQLDRPRRPTVDYLSVKRYDDGGIYLIPVEQIVFMATARNANTNELEPNITICYLRDHAEMLLLAHPIDEISELL